MPTSAVVALLLLDIGERRLGRQSLWTGATTVYRALLTAILDRNVFAGVSTPAAFEARIRAQHTRKTSFWAHVYGERQADDDDEPDPEK